MPLEADRVHPLRFAAAVAATWFLFMGLTGLGVWGIHAITPSILWRDQVDAAWHFQKEAWEILGQAPYGSPTRTGALDRAEPLVRQAVERAPRNVQYRVNHALILQEQQRPEEALEELAAALEIVGSTEEAPYALFGEIAVQLERWEEAEEPLRKAIEKEPLAPLHHERLAKSLLRQGKVEEGIEVFRHRVENLPAIPWNRMTAALEAVRVGRFEEAARWFDIPAKEGQVKGTIWYAVAVARAAVDDIEGAAIALSRYMNDLRMESYPGSVSQPPAGLEIAPMDDKTIANLRAAYRRGFSREWN